MDANRDAPATRDEADCGWFRRPRLSAILWGLAIFFAAIALIAVLDLLGLALLRLNNPSD
jgi:hypothetical protein